MTLPQGCGAQDCGFWKTAETASRRRAGDPRWLWALPAQARHPPTARRPGPSRCPLAPLPSPVARGRWYLEPGRLGWQSLAHRRPGSSQCLLASLAPAAPRERQRRWLAGPPAPMFSASWSAAHPLTWPLGWQSLAHWHQPPPLCPLPLRPALLALSPRPFPVLARHHPNMPLARQEAPSPCPLTSQASLMAREQQKPEPVRLGWQRLARRRPGPAPRLLAPRTPLVARGRRHRWLAEPTPTMFSASWAAALPSM